MLRYPKTDHGIVYRATEIMTNYEGWPSVCRDERGTLYSVCSGYRMRHICPFGKTVMNISYNEGKTWTPPIIINDTPLDDRDAGIVYLGDGKLLVTWFVHPADAYINQYANFIKNSCSLNESGLAIAQLLSYSSMPKDKTSGGSYVRLSKDYGVTWEETVKVPISSPHGPSLINDGSLIYLGKEFHSLPEDEITKDIIACYRSTDDGITWKKLSELAVPDRCVKNNFYEPHVIQLPNGRLLGMIRGEGKEVYHGFTIYETVSDDNGLTWSIPKSLDTAGSPPHLLLHSSGAVICVFGRREAPYGERALVSKDNGETWDEYILCDTAVDGDLGYPASVELNDGTIFTLYYQKYSSDLKSFDEKPSILYTKWSI